MEPAIKVEYLARTRLLYTVQHEEFFGTVTEMVRHGVTGFLVRDLDEMIKAMKFVDSLDRRECRRDVERRFSSKVMAQRYEELYRKLAGT